MGQKKLIQTKKTSPVSQSGFSYTLSHMNFGTNKLSLASTIPLEAISKQKKSHDRKDTQIFPKICVYLDVSGGIPKSITLSCEDFEWLKTLDYEFIPFNVENVMSMVTSSMTAP